MTRPGPLWGAESSSTAMAGHDDCDGAADHADWRNHVPSRRNANGPVGRTRGKGLLVRTVRFGGSGGAVVPHSSPFSERTGFLIRCWLLLVLSLSAVVVAVAASETAPSGVLSVGAATARNGGSVSSMSRERLGGCVGRRPGAGGGSSVVAFLTSPTRKPSTARGRGRSGGFGYARAHHRSVVARVSNPRLDGEVRMIGTYRRLPLRLSSSSSSAASNGRDDSSQSTSSQGNNDNGGNGGNKAGGDVEATSAATPPEDRAARVDEARALRERARLLRAEANEAESALRDRRRADREGSDARMDALLEELSAGTSEGEDPMVGRIRDRSVPISPGDFVTLIDRLYERERAARGAAPAPVASSPPRTQTAPEFNIGSTENAAGKGESVIDPAEAARLNSLAVRLLRAVDLLDREEEDRWLSRKKREDDPSAEAGLAASDAAVGDDDGRNGVGRRERRERIAPVLQARIRELRRAEREEFRRKVAMDSRQSVAILRRDDVEEGEGETLEEFILRTMNGTTTVTLTAEEADAGDATGGSSLSGIAAGIRGKLRGVLGGSNETSTLPDDGAPGLADEATKATAEANVSKIMMEVIAMPMWVPSSMLGFVASSPDELHPDDVRRVRDEVLAGCPYFFCTSSESTRLAAVFRGNFLSRSGGGGDAAAGRVAALTGLGLGTMMGGGGDGAAGSTGDDSRRSKNATGVADPISRVAFDDVRRRLDEAGGGLSDRVQLFLLDDPEWRPGDDSRRRLREDGGPGPVILAVPGSVRPEQGEIRGLAGTALATLSTCATLFTTFAYAVAAYALNSNFFNSLVNDNDMSVVKSCFPLAFGVIAIQVAHELGHVLGARLSRVKIGMPVPLPSLQIGTFGCITPLRSFPDSRRDLMQVALSGPVVTLFLSVMFMIAGLNLTVGCAADVLPTLPVVPVALLKSSFLTGGLVSVLAPKVMTFPLSQPVPVHPLFMVGLSGMVSSALNLLPVGRLDGGRAFSAAFGRRAAVAASLLTLLVMAVAALSGLSSLLIFWGLIVTLFQRQPEIPLRDEITRLDDVRLGAYLSLVLLSLMILLPFPGGSPM